MGGPCGLRSRKMEERWWLGHSQRRWRSSEFEPPLKERMKAGGAAMEE